MGGGGLIWICEGAGFGFANALGEGEMLWMSVWRGQER